MLGLIVLFVLAAGCLFAGGFIVRDEPQSFSGYLLGILGIMFFVILTFVTAPTTLHTGSPTTSIDAGEYQVAFVYVVGDTVSVGIKEESREFGEGVHLFLYQFSRNAFEGVVKYDAKKLVVIESGEFKKLRLE